MSNKAIIWGGVAAVAVIAVFFLVRGLQEQPADQQVKQLQMVTVGIQTSPAMALVMVAKDKGFFEQEGLNVEIQEFTAGKFALEAFLGGSLDFAISGDVPAALAALQGNRFIVPAQVVRATKNEVRVVARRDGNLETADAYFKAKKRKLATSFGGGPEFFTYEFLNKLGITADQVEVISQKPGDMPAALAQGSVDAIAIFDPFAFIAERQLDKEAITFTDESVYSELYIIEAHESVRQDSAALEKLLRGLIAAEKFTQENSAEAQAIVARYTKLDAVTLAGIWDNFDFRVAITPQLFEFWNREAAWAKDTDKVAKTTATPDFSQLIFAEPLQKVAPAAVEL